jgi:hypothetical protein
MAYFKQLTGSKLPKPIAKKFKVGNNKFEYLSPKISLGTSIVHLGLLPSDKLEADLFLKVK